MEEGTKPHTYRKKIRFAFWLGGPCWIRSRPRTWKRGAPGHLCQLALLLGFVVLLFICLYRSIRFHAPRCISNQSNATSKFWWHCTYGPVTDHQLVSCSGVQWMHGKFFATSSISCQLSVYLVQLYTPYV
jgi:hypothetical protein